MIVPKFWTDTHLPKTIFLKSSHLFFVSDGRIPPKWSLLVITLWYILFADTHEHHHKPLSSKGRGSAGFNHILQFSRVYACRWRTGVIHCTILLLCALNILKHFLFNRWFGTCVYVSCITSETLCNNVIIITWYHVFLNIHIVRHWKFMNYLTLFLGLSHKTIFTCIWCTPK